MHAPTCSRELSNAYREQAFERVTATEHFGRPPTPRNGPRLARSPRWRSLAELHPELVAELSPRNEALDSAELGAGSRLKPWWRCRSCGHEWRASVSNRTLRGSGCPRCAVRMRAERRSRVEPERSLAVARPGLVAELDLKRNEHLTVTTLGIASMRKVWWRCRQCDHSWETTVASRAGGTGCPACWNRRRGTAFSVVPPERSLAHRAPEVADELHPNRNPPELDPGTLGARSSKTVWWLCGVCGHEWQARVADRATGARWPMCARNQRRTQAG